MEWLYHIGVPENQIEDLASNSANTVPVMMPYIDAFFMPRAYGAVSYTHLDVYKRQTLRRPLPRTGLWTLSPRATKWPTIWGIPIILRMFENEQFAGSRIFA